MFILHPTVSAVWFDRKGRDTPSSSTSFFLKDRPKRKLVSSCYIPSVTFRRDSHGSDHTTRRSVTCHGVRDGLFHQSSRFFLRHAFSEFGIHQTINEKGSTSTECKSLFQARSSHDDIVDLSAFHRVPSSHNHTGTQIALVLVANALHQMSCCLDSRLAPCFDTIGG